MRSPVCGFCQYRSLRGAAGRAVRISVYGAAGQRKVSLRNPLQSHAFGDIITWMTINEYIGNYAPAWRGHTPGHKGKLDRRDVTEILDIFPGDLITRAEERGARLYGAEKLRFLVGGSSVGIKASVLASGAERIVTDVYRHRAVDEAARLAGAELVTAGGGEENGLPRLTTAEDIAGAMEKSGATAAVVQYPDYYGRTPDLAGIEREVRRLGGTLICDSAHGAHFALRPDLFPESAVMRSDACNMSAHKTLGGLTQTAFLACRGNIADKADEMLDVLGTTSPNYMLLASLELCVDNAGALAGEYDRLKKFSDGLRSRYACLPNADFTRVVFDCGGGRGREAAYAFYDNGAAAEKYDDRYVVFILTPFDEDKELEALERAAAAVLG